MKLEWNIVWNIFWKYKADFRSRMRLSWGLGRAWGVYVDCFTNVLIIPWGYLSPKASLGRTNSPLQAVSIAKLRPNAPGHVTFLILSYNDRMFWYQDLLLLLLVTSNFELQSWSQGLCTWYLENMKNSFFLLNPVFYLKKTWWTGNQN